MGNNLVMKMLTAMMVLAMARMGRVTMRMMAMMALDGEKEEKKNCRMNQIACIAGLGH